MRQAPLGTDRNHSRYWIFSGDKKGIYVEKGKLVDLCYHDYIYTFNSKPFSNPFKLYEAGIIFLELLFFTRLLQSKSLIQSLI